MNGTSATGNQLLRRQPDIPGYLTEQRRSQIPPLVHRNSRAPAIRVTVLDMRTTLANRDKTKAFQ